MKKIRMKWLVLLLGIGFPGLLMAQTPETPKFTLGLDALLLGQAGPEAPQPYHFGFQEANLSFAGTVDSTWNFFSDFSVDTNGNVSPEEVFGVANLAADLQLRVGKGYISFGKHALLFNYAYPFILEPLAVENTLGDDGLQDGGVELTWNTPLPWDCHLILGAYVAQGLSPDSPLDLGSNSYDNIPYLLHLGNLFSLPGDTTVEWGASALTGMGTDGLHHAVYGTDLTVKGLPQDKAAFGWILQAEYLNRMGFDQNLLYSPGSDGWYASFQARFTSDWWAGVRAEEAFNAQTNALQEDDPTLPPGHLQRGCLNLAWAPSDSSFTRLEYDVTRLEGAGGAVVLDHRVMLQFNYNIGFHFSSGPKKPVTPAP